jgi:hypothetical protein
MADVSPLMELAKLLMKSMLRTELSVGNATAVEVAAAAGTPSEAVSGEPEPRARRRRWESFLAFLSFLPGLALAEGRPRSEEDRLLDFDDDELARSIARCNGCEGGTV